MTYSDKLDKFYELIGMVRRQHFQFNCLYHCDPKVVFLGRFEINTLREGTQVFKLLRQLNKYVMFESHSHDKPQLMGFDIVEVCEDSYFRLV